MKLQLAALPLFAFIAQATAPARAVEPHPALEAWLSRQAELRSWSADVVQTRSLETLTRPLETAGRVWFVQPDRFRWQLGEPARTIAVRNAGELLVVYPRLLQAERYPLSGELDPAWQQALALLEVGFPRDRETFYSRYEPVSSARQGDVWRFELLPAAAEARRLVERVAFEVSATDSTLLATELAFADGSSMRNAFSNHRRNPEIDPATFAVDLAGYEVVSPLERR